MRFLILENEVLPFGRSETANKKHLSSSEINIASSESGIARLGKERWGHLMECKTCNQIVGQMIYLLKSRVLPI